LLLDSDTLGGACAGFLMTRLVIIFLFLVRTRGATLVPSLLFPVRPSPTRRGLLSPAHRARRPQPLTARLHMCIKYPWVELNYDIIFFSALRIE